MTPDLEPIIREMGALWRTYADAFQTGDMDSLLPVFAEPVVVQTRLAGNVYQRRADIGANNNKLLAFYRAQGVVHAQASITEVDPVHRHFIQMHVRYRLMDIRGSEIVAFTTVYGLKHQMDRWLIHLVIAQDELEAWAARGVTLGAGV